MKKLKLLTILLGVTLITGCGSTALSDTQSREIIPLEGNTENISIKEDSPTIVQDPSTNDNEEEMPEVSDFSGIYKNENHDSIRFESTGVNGYLVYFFSFDNGFYSGEGNWVDGGIETAFKDDFCTVFFKEDDETYTLRITQSNIEGIEEQHDFSGFELYKEGEDIESFVSEALNISFDYNTNDFYIETIPEDNSVYVQCIIDPEYSDENYLLFKKTEDVDIDTVFNEMEETYSSNDCFFSEELAFFGYEGRESKFLGYANADQTSVYIILIPSEDGVYITEMSYHLYGDNQDYKANLIFDSLNELADSIKFPS